MLIVVAIIAILVAVSIPIVGNSLERARQATDAANERSFKAELIICYLNEKLSDPADGAFAPGTGVYVYDAVNGKVVPYSKIPDTGYGKCTNMKHKDTPYLFGMVDTDGMVYMKWDAKGTAAPSNVKTAGAATLHNGTVIS